MMRLRRGALTDRDPKPMGEGTLSGPRTGKGGRMGKTAALTASLGVRV